MEYIEKTTKEIKLKFKDLKFGGEEIFRQPEWINLFCTKLLEAKINKQKVLEIYHNLYSYLAEQGSAEWLKQRRIGGSSVAGILGESSYSSQLKVAEHILGLKKFNGNLYTNWGHLCEPFVISLLKFLEPEFVHYEFGSIPGKRCKNGNIITSYSPDGLIYTPTIKSFKPFLTGRAPPVNDRIGLLEIKCPYNRVPTNEVPQHYMPQLQSGFMTIPIADYALFVDASIKACGLDEISDYKSFKFVSFVGFYGDINIKCKKHKRKKSRMLALLDSIDTKQPNNSIIADIADELDHLHIQELISITHEFMINKNINICRRDIEEFHRGLVIHTNLVDLCGSINGMHSICTSKEYERIITQACGNNKHCHAYYGKIWVTEEIESERHLIREFEQEIMKFESIHKDAFAVLPIRVNDLKVLYEKKDPEFEAKNLPIIMEFADRVEKIKSMPKEDWKSAVNVFK